MEQLRFAYGSRPGSLVVGVLVGIALLGFGGYAVLNSWGLRLYSVLDLEPDVARWFYLFIAALGLVCAIGLIVTMTAGRREVTVSPDRITAPKGETSRRIVSIDPSTITRLSLPSYQGMVTLQIKHAGGTLRLRSQHFDGAAAFDECVHAVQAVAPHAEAR